jgi:acyl carrier protein
MLDTGEMEYQGRIDHQVKIRGFRIEPGEVENRLLQHEAITQAVVVTREKTDKKSIENIENRYLSAYFVSEKNIEAAELRKYLAKDLPEYMIPAYFVRLPAIPLTPNGKVDKKALPQPAADTGARYKAPRNRVEVKLAQIWAAILGIEKEKPGIDDNFFQLGGHSLMATKMIANIHKEFHMRVPLAEIFRTPTIREIAELISKSEKSPFIDLEPKEKREYYELSFNQRRLWIIHRLAPESSAYNIAGMVSLQHEVDEYLLKKVIYQLMQRHDSLRTGFKEVDNQPVQFVQDTVDVPFRTVDLTSLAESAKQQEKEAVYMEESRRTFDLTRPVLFRTVLVKTDQSDYELIFNLHHIITDGWSMGLLKTEFSQLYEAYRQGKEMELEPLIFQYRDFSQWHYHQLHDPVLKKNSFQYWIEKLESGVPVLELPVDFIESPEQGAAPGAGYRCALDNHWKEKLKEVAEDNHTTLFNVMFAIYILWLSRFSHGQDIVCSIISAGREHISLHNIIGFFVNSLLFKTCPNYGEPFHDLLKKLSMEVLETLKHQHYPLELVCEDLKMKHPDIPVAFNMVNLGDEAQMADIDSFAPYHETNLMDVKFDIEVYIAEFKNGINIYCKYRKELFKPSTIEYNMKEYISLLEFCVNFPGKTYNDYRKKEKKHTFKREKGNR